jgi:hypothetical protein
VSAVQSVAGRDSRSRGKGRSEEESNTATMIMNSNEILTDFDRCAAEFNFPVLDNAYVEFGAARLTAFRSSGDWLLCIEVLGFSLREVEFVNDLYAFGSCVEGGGFIGEDIPLRSSPENPLYDRETNQGIADWCRWSVKLGDETLRFSPTREEYADAGVLITDNCGPGTITEIELLRFLIHRVGSERLFMHDHQLLEHFPNCKNLRKFVQTSHWHHPDVAEGEKPSENACFQSLTDALSKTDASVFNAGKPNTRWQFWANRQAADLEED